MEDEDHLFRWPVNPSSLGLEYSPYVFIIENMGSEYYYHKV